jgi:hypothetical protein
MAVGAVVARILTQYSDKGSKAAQKDIAKLGKNIDGFAKKSTRAFGLAAAASAALAFKIGKDAVQAAIADQKSQVLLANALRNTAGASNEAISGVENYITSLQKQFSVVDDDLRPAMARLTAATGSITAAQGLMQTALDVSASSGADLGTAVGAIIKATSGQFKALKTLVPGLSNATVKSKDFAKALEEVNKQTSGAASKRSQTLEYRLAGLKIAFGEILETLGYALLPVIEKFATTISTKVLPQIEAFVALNKDKLAASFQIAADAAVKLLAVSISFGDWVSNNMGLVKTMAAIIVGMFAVGRASAFIIMLGQVTAAMATLRATAAGAAIASAFATGGVSSAAGAAAVAGIVAAVGIGVMAPSSTSGGSGGKTLPSTGNPLPKLGASGAAKGSAAALGFPNNFGAKPPVVVTTVDSTTAALQKFIESLNAGNKSLKTAKTMQDKINAEAVRQNLARQARLSGSSTIAIGGSGSLSYGNKGTNVVVNVAGSVSTQEDLVTSIVNGIERTTRRSFGTVGAFDRVAIL